MIAEVRVLGPHPAWYGLPAFLTKINDFSQYSLLHSSFRDIFLCRSSGRGFLTQVDCFFMEAQSRIFTKHSDLSKMWHTHQMIATMVSTMNSTMCLDKS